MAYNGSGVWIAPAGQPVVTGTVIQSSTFNALVGDIGATFNNVVTRDGQGPMTAPFKLQSGTVTIPGLSFNAESSTGLYWPATGQLAITTSGIEVARFKANGVVLIDTTTDDGVNKLQVNGGITGTNATLSGAAAVSGNSTVGGTFSVTGSTTLSSNATVGGTLGVTGNTTLSTLTTSGAVTLSAGTANGVVYLNGSKAVSSGTALVFDGANLGIGITPSAWSLAGYKALELGSNGSGLYAGPNDVNLMSNAYFNSGWKYASTNPAAVYEVNNGLHTWSNAPSGTINTSITLTPAMILSNGGNLGIGNTPSAWRAGAKAIQYGALGSVSVLQNGTNCLSFGAYEGSANVFNYTTTGDSPCVYAQVSGGHTWYNAPAGTAGGTATLTTRMILDQSGNLGISCTPSAWNGSWKGLQVNSYGSLVSDTSSNVIVGSNWYVNGSGTDIYVGSNYATAYRQHSGQHNWLIAPSGTAGGTIPFVQAMAVDASGNLLVGYTSTSQIATNVGGHVLAPGGGAAQHYIGHVSGTATGSSYTSYYYNGGLIGGITQNGTTGIAINSTANLDLTGSTVTYGGIEVGYKDVPRQATSGGTAALTERGKCYATTGNILFNTGFNPGSAWSVYNDSASAVTLTQGSGLTMRLAGTTTTGSRTLAARGMATVWINSSTEYIVSGAGVS